MEVIKNYSNLRELNKIIYLIIILGIYPRYTHI